MTIKNGAEWWQSEVEGYAPPTAPAPAQEPLTDEQIDRLREANSEGRGAGWRFNFKGFARAIEAAHGITKGQP